VAWIYQLSTLSDTPLSATLLPMIPRSALISSAGSGRIRKGLGGCGKKNRACGGVQTKKQKRGERSQSLSQSFLVRTRPQHHQNIKTSPGPPRWVMVPLVLLVHPELPWSTFLVKLQNVWITMDRSGPGGPRGPQPPLVDQERSGPPWTTLRHFPDKAVFFFPHPANPLPILPDPADVLPSQPFALLPPQSISSAGCHNVHSGLSPSGQHIPLPSEPIIQLPATQLIRNRPTPSHAFRAYNCPPDALLLAYTL